MADAPKLDRVNVFLFAWLAWVLAVMSWVWDRSVTIDHVSPGLAVGLAAVFGLLTYEGAFLVHLPVIAAMGWMFSSGLVESKLHRVGWLGGFVLKCGLTLGWLKVIELGIRYGSDPPY